MKSLEAVEYHEYSIFLAIAIAVSYRVCKLH